MSAPCSPAARLAMMLPTAHANAAPITSAKPIAVPVRPLASLYAASTIIPAAAIAAPTMLCRWKRSPENATARPIVKNTCIWITSDDSPAGMPSLMPRNSRPNWQTPIAKPYATTSRHGIAGRRTKNTIGTAARKKRSAASVNGGTSSSATLIGTNV